MFIDEHIITLGINEDSIMKFSINDLIREVLGMIDNIFISFPSFFILLIPFLLGVYGNRLLVLFAYINGHEYKKIVFSNSQKEAVLLFNQEAN